MRKWVEEVGHEKYIAELSEGGTVVMRCEFMVDPPRSPRGAHEWAVTVENGRIRVRAAWFTQKEGSNEFEGEGVRYYWYRIFSESQPYTWFLRVEELERRIKENGLQKTYNDFLNAILAISEIAQKKYIEGLLARR